MCVLSPKSLFSDFTFFLWVVAPEKHPIAELLALEDLVQALPNDAGGLGGVDGRPDALLLVVVDDGPGLLVEGGEALAEGVNVVVGALDEWLARHVVCHWFLWRAVGRGRCK
jgi:hypothetical protein